jgi:uncharacterized membrane protein YheB (UPF0754 family)
VSDLVLLFLTVPTITAFIGWVTNWAAVKMIFWPRAFVGVGSAGWQGIIYKQGSKFAVGVADMVTQNLITTRELVGRLDPDDIGRLLAADLDAMNPALAREAVELVQPGAWDRLPEHVRQMVLAQLKAQTPALTRTIFARLQARADDLVDLHQLVSQRLSGGEENVERLARLTRRIARNEFKFIELSGGVIGVIVGLVQIPVWQWLQIWWTLPIVGALVGLGTNYVAIEMIFRPHEPKRYFGLLRYQGLFPKRQAAIAADYGDSARKEILTPETFLAHVGDEGRLELLTSIVRATIREHLEAEWNKVKAMVPQVQVTPEMIDRVADAALAHLAALVPVVRPRFEAYLDEKLDVANTVERRLAVLPKPQFERVIRGIFEEDELTLILVGGFLGAAVGFVQAGLVLAI